MYNVNSSKFDSNVFYTVSEAANIIGVHRSTVWRWIKLFNIKPRVRKVNNRLEYKGSDFVKLLNYYG